MWNREISHCARSGMIRLAKVYTGIFFFLSPLVVAEATTGREVMEGVYNQTKIHTTQSADVLLEITDKGGKKRERWFSLLTKHEDLDTKSLLKFYKPQNVKGTGLLSHNLEGEQKPIQWIYLPAFRSVRQLSTSEQNDSFMGSDFSYYDIGGRKLDQDVHELLKEDKKYYYIRSYPKDEEDVYAYYDTTVAKSIMVVRRVVFYDRSAKKIKMLENKRVVKIGKMYLIAEAVMFSEMTGGHTQLVKSEIEVDVSISDQDVGLRGLKGQ